MSIKVDFYQFKKRANSTIQPNQSPIPNLTPVASYDCILKAGCGIMSPVEFLINGCTLKYPLFGVQVPFPLQSLC